MPAIEGNGFDGYILHRIIGVDSKSFGGDLAVTTIERNGLQTNAVHTELGFVIAEALVYQLINQALP